MSKSKHDGLEGYIHVTPGFAGAKPLAMHGAQLIPHDNERLLDGIRIESACLDEELATKHLHSLL